MDNVQDNKFLGEGKLSKLMLKFSIPCVLSLLVSALYNIVDQIFIGNSELSTLGNAATGVVFPIFVIAQAFAWCVGDGCAAYLNICQGKGEAQNAHKAIGSGITVTIAVSLLLIAIFMPLRRQVLMLFGASENTIEYAVEYFVIILSFFPVYMLSNMINAVLRADGQPAWSMASMLAGAIVNIALDPLFIFAFKWGMSGAAWATAIGQAVSLVISIVCLFRTKSFKLSLKSLIPNFKELGKASLLGLSSFITQITIVITGILSNVLLAKYGGMSHYGSDIPVALIGIENKVYTVVINIVVGIVLGCQPIISYNMGARNFDRVKKLYLYILACTLAVGLIATILFEAAPRGIVSIFGTPSNIPNPEDYWEFATKLFRIYLALVTVTCVVKMSSIFFQALGKPVGAIVSSLVRDIVCFLPLIIGLPVALGIDGILYAAPISDAIALVVVVVMTLVIFKDIFKKKPLVDVATVSENVVADTQVDTQCEKENATI